MHQPSEVLALTQEDTHLRSCYTESTDSVIWPVNWETIHPQEHCHTLMGFN